MIVAVTGGRNFLNGTFVYQVLRAFHSKHNIAELHEGGARGWDMCCRYKALDLGIYTITHWANWNGPKGKGAGIERNTLMLDRAKPEALIAGPGGKGTANMIMQAEQRGIKVYKYAP